jgi:hypothetical protein
MQIKQQWLYWVRFNANYAIELLTFYFIMAFPHTFKTDLNETFTIGTDTYFTSIPEGYNHGVAFEDDLDTGYFYAFSTGAEFVILDALHIYNVSDVVLRQTPCNLAVVWTEDNHIAALLINGYCHAIFDFNKRVGFCRNGFPENKGEWRQTDARVLTDELIVSIFPK